MFTIMIHTENAAFDVDTLPFEIARILRGLADETERSLDPREDMLTRLRDTNGNVIGAAGYSLDAPIDDIVSALVKEGNA